MTFFWGSNFTVLKAALRELPGPRASTGSGWCWPRSSSLLSSRGVKASGRRFAAVARGDWPAIVGLSLVGHCLYQALFLGGVARTSVGQQRADLRLHACHGQPAQRGPGTRTSGVDAMGRHGALARRHLLRRRARCPAGHFVADGRPAHPAGDVLLVGLHGRHARRCWIATRRYSSPA